MRPQTTRPLVSRSSRWAGSAKSLAEALAQQRDEGALVVARGGVDGQARGLVEHQQPVVLEDDGQLGGRLRLLAGAAADAEGEARVDGRGGLEAAPSQMRPRWMMPWRRSRVRRRIFSPR